MDDLIVVQLSPKQCKQMIIMNFLDSIGFFDSKLSQLIINSDKDGKIRHISLKKDFDTTGMEFS